MNDTQLTTVQETVFDLQRLHHLMSILVSGYETETIAFQKMKETSYAGAIMEQYLSAFYIILDQITSAKEKLSPFFEEGDRPSPTTTTRKENA